MRISPKSLSPSDALAKAKSKSEARNTARVDAALARAVESEDSAETSPAEIDARRAQQLLERAGMLATRGDVGAAILATRQALALSPANAAGYLLLGGLLEHNRDFVGARAAYAKSAGLAPDNSRARANLERLTAYLDHSQGAARQFQFDEKELFDATHAAAPHAAAPHAAESSAPVTSALDPAPGNSPSASAGVSAVAEFDASLLDESMLPSVEVRLPPARAEVEAQKSAAPLAAAAPLTAQPAEPAAGLSRVASVVGGSGNGVARVGGDRRRHNVPVATERRRRPAKVSALSATPLMVAPVVAVPAQAEVSAAASELKAGAALPEGISAPTATPLRARPLDAGFDMDTAINPLPRAPRAPLSLDLPPLATGSLWQQIVVRPSFYARTLPMVGVAVLSLGFLGWARGRALSQLALPAADAVQPRLTIAQTSSETAPVTEASAPDAPNASASGAPVAGAQSAPAGNGTGFPISNAPFTFPASPSTATATASNAGNSGASNGSAGNGGAGNGAPTARDSNRMSPRPSRRSPAPVRSLPSFPSVSVAPAPVAPFPIAPFPVSGARSASSNGSAGNSGASNGSAGNGSAGNGGVVLPRPTINMPSPPEARTRILPQGNGLNPAGSPNSGYVRVTQGRVGNGVMPSQPGGVARQNESNANDAARNGQTDQAIAGLSDAIRADGDNAGFRYQQRATLFLQRGDYSRASDDFQSAISAYQSQIARGDDVAQARRGLNSARSGLNLALAGKRS